MNNQTFDSKSKEKIRRCFPKITFSQRGVVENIQIKESSLPDRHCNGRNAPETDLD
jgi:hypothetical protein